MFPRRPKTASAVLDKARPPVLKSIIFGSGVQKRFPFIGTSFLFVFSTLVQFLLVRLVAQLVKSGFPVFVEKGAGANSMFSDAEYVKSGATIVDAQEAWSKDLVIKIRPPYPSVNGGTHLFVK